MASNNSKPGMMIYFAHWYAPLELLDGEQIKELLGDVLRLGETGEYPEGFSCKAVEVFFKQMVGAVLHDDEQYQKKIEQRKKAGQASANARQRTLADVNDRQQLSAVVNQYNTNQYSTNQYSTIQTKPIQSNTDQYSSAQTNSKYWGDNKLWEERCEKYGVDPYDPEQKAIFEKSWCRSSNEEDISF